MNAPQRCTHTFTSGGQGLQNQFLLVAQRFDESLNTPSVDQIALPDVVKIFLLSFLSDGIIDSVYPVLTEALKKCFHPPVPLELQSAVTDL